MKIVKLQSDHLYKIDLQQAQSYLRKHISQELAKGLEHEYASFTAMDGDKVIACAGIIKIWEGRGLVWSYLSDDAGKYLVHIHKATKRMLDVIEFDRLEAMVDEGFNEGHRWVKMLGFKLETPEPMRKYTPDGRSSYLYSRVR